MSGYFNDIHQWLKELENHEAADFFERNCYIDYTFKDVAYDHDDNETIIISVFIGVPLKVYKTLDKYKELIIQIEEAINEYNESTKTYALIIEWQPTLSKPKTEHLKSYDELKKVFSEDYVSAQIDLMKKSAIEHPHLAVGVAKELIESCSKYVLDKSNITYSNEWDMPKLVKEANKALFQQMANENNADQAIRKVIIGLTTVVQGITEIRNQFGSGHGHNFDFKQLDGYYTQFIINTTAEMILFWRLLADQVISQPASDT